MWIAKSAISVSICVSGSPMSRSARSPDRGCEIKVSEYALGTAVGQTPCGWGKHLNITHIRWYITPTIPPDHPMTLGMYFSMSPSNIGLAPNESSTHIHATKLHSVRNFLDKVVNTFRLWHNVYPLADIFKLISFHKNRCFVVDSPSWSIWQGSIGLSPVRRQPITSTNGVIKVWAAKSSICQNDLRTWIPEQQKWWNHTFMLTFIDIMFIQTDYNLIKMHFIAYTADSDCERTLHIENNKFYRYLHYSKTRENKSNSFVVNYRWCNSKFCRWWNTTICNYSNALLPFHLTYLIP